MDSNNLETIASPEHKPSERLRLSEVVRKCCKTSRMGSEEESLISESLGKRSLSEEEVVLLLFENDGQEESWDRVKSAILEFLNKYPSEAKHILEFSSKRFGWPFNIQIRTEKQKPMKMYPVKTSGRIVRKPLNKEFICFGRLWADNTLITSKRMNGVKRERVYAQTAGNLLRAMVDANINGDSELTKTFLDLPVLDKPGKNFTDLLNTVRETHTIDKPRMRWFVVGDENTLFHVASLEIKWEDRSYTSEFYAASTKADAINLASQDLLRGLLELSKTAKIPEGKLEQSPLQKLQEFCNAQKAKLTWRFSPPYHTVSPPHLCVCKITLEDGSRLYAFGSKIKRREALELAAKRMLEKIDQLQQ